MFIPVAEECGLIGKLGDQLLRAACRDAVAWPAPLTLAFNISPLQLRDPTLGLRILAILGETGLDPRRLEIEVTESALVENIEVARQIVDHLRQAGVRIALDDFGTGYATLSQLLELHLDKIKIDRSFVDRLGRDKESTSSAPSSGSPPASASPPRPKGWRTPSSSPICASTAVPKARDTCSARPFRRPRSRRCSPPER